MKRALRPRLALVAALALCALALPRSAWSRGLELAEGWKFHRGEAAGAEQQGFDDAGWRTVNAPHDWSIEDLPGQTHPFDRNAPGGPAVAYTEGGVGWYRRAIELPADVAARTVLLRFEAVYMDAEVFVNGRRAGRHPYGYTAFTLDVSDKVHPGRNLVALRVNNAQPSSRWYSGSGIIRPVRLEILDKLHLDPDGPAITTPQASAAHADVRVRTALVNAGAAPRRARLVSRVLDGAGREVARVSEDRDLGAGASLSFDQTLALASPSLWSPQAPSLYTLDQTLEVGGQAVDRRRTRFGVRTLSFDAQRGFLLNGERMLLRGGAIHSDNYMLGGIALPRAEERKLELMKAAGYNAVRSAHNPPSEALLDAADRLGMLVIDEAFDAWSVGKTANDHARFFKDDWRSEVRSMVVAGRNHPSVVLWSIGNEIPNFTEGSGHEEASELAALVRQLDPTRPVTAAVNNFGPGADETMLALDVAGYNYREDRYVSDHAAFPRRVMYGSESFSGEAFDTWSAAESLPWVVGDFVWTGFDYLGEAGIGWTGFGKQFEIGPYPWQLAMSGEIDATGRLRPAAYYREVLWKTGLTPTSAFVEWPDAIGSLPDKAAGGPMALRNWAEEDLHPYWGPFGLPADYLHRKVVVFSENEEVELFLNGRSLGRKPVSRATEYKAVFHVQYEPGVLKAIGYVHGKPVSQWTLETPGQPAAIRLIVDRPRIEADGRDLAYVTAELVDAQGRPTYARADDKTLSFSVEGAGVLAGVGNGDPVALESFQSGRRSTFHGRAVAVVRAGRTPGAIVLHVRGGQLSPAAATITARPVGP